jgi:hypothetical protein
MIAQKNVSPPRTLSHKERKLRNIEFNMKFAFSYGKSMHSLINKMLCLLVLNAI